MIDFELTAEGVDIRWFEELRYSYVHGIEVASDRMNAQRADYVGAYTLGQADQICKGRAL